MKFRNLFFTVLIFIFPSILFSQYDYAPCYIIKNSNDTVYGHGKMAVAQEFCVFSEDDKNEYKEYLPGEIKEFRIIDDRLYKAYNIKGEELFLEYLIDGELDLFVKRGKYGDRYFIEKDSLPITELKYGTLEYTDENNITYEKKNNQYMNILNFYMKDVPEMRSEINNIYYPEQRNLIQLAENYHYKVCDDSECINYTKHNFLKKKIAIEPYFAVNLHNAYYTPQYGVFVNFWVPLSNEKLFFKIGLAAASLSYQDKSDTISQRLIIPFYWQYVLGYKKIKPTIGIGFPTGFFILSLQGGLIYDVSKCSSFSLSTSVDGFMKILDTKEIYNNVLPHSFMFSYIYRFD